VYGLRPTANTIPQDGFAPPGAPAAPLPSDIGWISTVGPIARTPADIRTALSITADRHEAPPARELRAQGLRLGLMLDDPGCPLAGDVGAVLSDAADRPTAAGVEVVEGWPSGVDSSATMASFGFALQRFMAAADPTSDWSATSAEIDRERQRRAEMRAAWARYFTEVDAFVCP
jgi:amidase